MKEQLFEIVNNPTGEIEECRLNITTKVRQDPSIMGEYLQYCLQSNNDLSIQTGDKSQPLRIQIDCGEYPAFPSDLCLTTGNQIAEQILTGDTKQEYEAIIFKRKG